MVVDYEKGREMAQEMLSKGVSSVSVRDIKYKDKTYYLVAELKEQEK